jgi:hypothetical protein
MLFINMVCLIVGLATGVKGMTVATSVNGASGVSLANAAGSAPRVNRGIFKAGDEVTLDSIRFK